MEMFGNETELVVAWHCKCTEGSSQLLGSCLAKSLLRLHQSFFSLCPVLLTSLPHRYWSQVSFLHTNIWLRPVSQECSLLKIINPGSTGPGIGITSWYLGSLPEDFKAGLRIGRGGYGLLPWNTKLISRCVLLLTLERTASTLVLFHLNKSARAGWSWLMHFYAAFQDSVYLTKLPTVSKNYSELLIHL